MQGASLCLTEPECLVRGRLVWDESRVLIDELRWKKDKEGLLIHDLKLNFHRYIGERKRKLFDYLASRKLRAQPYILKSIDRRSFGERRTKKGYLTMVWSWIFIDTSVNFDVYHRLIRRCLGVDVSITSGVRIRTTTTCTPNATIKTSRRTVAVERTRKASHNFVSEQ